MAIDKILQIYDEQGNLVDYDILASDVKFQPDGKDLPTKLAEMQDEIGDGGYTPPQDGIPKTDLAPSVQASLDKADSAYQKPASGIPATDIADGVIPDTSNLATKTEVANKVDKNGTDSLMTAAEHTKLGNLPTATELATQMNAKANDNAVVKTISVNGGTPQSPVSGNVNISVEGAAGEDGITPHIGSNGNWWIGPETDQNNDTNIKAQGPMGSVTITDGDIDTLEVHNALNANTGILGMGGAMRIKSNLDFVYSKLQALLDALGNIAFWEGKPANLLPQSLDWSVPQITVTLDKTNLSANAMITNASDQEITGTSVSVDEGSGLTLKIKPRAGYAITGSPSATIGGVSQTLTESNGVYTLVLDSVTEAITIAISATAVAARSVTLNLTGCTMVSGPTSIANGGGGTFVFAANEGYTLPTSAPTVTNGTVTSWDSSTGTLVISDVSGDVEISIAAVEALPYEVPTGGELLYWWDGLTVQAGDTAWVDKINGLSVPKSSNNDSTTTPDATNHCWKFENSYNSSGRGLSIDSQSLDNIDPDECTIEVVYKPTLWSSNDFKRANVCIFTRRNSNSDDTLGIYFVTKEEGTSGFITGCNAGNVKDGTWALNNVANQMYCVGMNNDYAVSNGTALALMTGTSATGYTTNTGSTNGKGAICIGCYSNGSNKYAVMHGNIYAIRIYSGHLTEAQMLANQKVDNQRYGLGLTLPETVQSNS